MSAYIPHFILTTTEFNFITHMDYKGSDLTITQRSMKRRSVSPRGKESHVRNSTSSPIVETIPFHSECGQHFLCSFVPELEQYIEKTDVIL